LNHQATGGQNGVHLAIDATGRFLAVANYASGTVAVLPINQDGSLGTFTDLTTLKGTPGRIGGAAGVASASLSVRSFAPISGGAG
jgi:6-phosphogluconolactonase (cycloisomerase 2 family)